MILRNRWSKPSTPVRVVESVKPVYAYDHIKRELVEVGKRDFNAYVASFYESSLLKNKIARFRNGDIQALNSVKGIYADISGMPTDYNSLQNLVSNATNLVNKQGFGSIPEFVQSAIDLLNNPEVNPENKEKEVVSDES